MRIRELKTRDELKTLSGEWDRLLGARGEEVLASNFLWVTSWWAHLGQHKDLRVLVAEDGDRVVGIAPLYVETIYRRKMMPVRVCRFIGDGLSDYGCLLAKTDRTAIYTLFLSYLEAQRDWHELQLHSIPDINGDFERLSDVGARLGFHIDPEACEANRYLFIRTDGGFPAYTKSLRRNLRHDLAKRERRLNEAGGFEVRFTRDMDLPGFLSAAAAIHSDRQRDLGRQSFFDNGTEGAFVREVLTAYHERGWLEYVAMTINGRIVAYRLGFRYGGVVYDWNTGFDPLYNTFSVGKVLLYRWLEDLFRRPEVVEFNFMRGDSEFKRMYASDFRLHRDFSVRHPRSLYARGLTLAESVWRAAKRARVRETLGSLVKNVRSGGASEAPTDGPPDHRGEPD